MTSSLNRLLRSALVAGDERADPVAPYFNRQVAAMTAAGPMNVDDWGRVRAVFDLALEIPDALRAVFVASRLADAPALAGRVLAMLSADMATTDPVRRVQDWAPDLLADAAQQRADVLRDRYVGQCIGPYRLTGVLGMGGMGTVYRGEREDGKFEHTVAVKLVRPEWGTLHAMRRFDTERRILASLKHANIAQLIDGGALKDGTPYLALEYVEGQPVTWHCETLHLGLHDRLRLFLQACDAVQFAHSRLVLHRDIKPSNLLVDSHGQAKLLDFGVAHVLADANPSAELSGERLLTVEYAAPELIAGAAPSVGSDVYSLGVLLYELCCGSTPFQSLRGDNAALMAASAGQAPTRPSEIASLTSVPSSALRGDIDAIVLRALCKNVEERYATVREFAADIQAHLQRRPVSVRRSEPGYALVRFGQRHAWSVAMGATMLLALLVITAAALLQARRADAERAAALAAAERARSALTLLTEVFQAADPESAAGHDVTARDLLDQGADLIRRRPDDDSRAELLIAMANAYNGLAEYSKAFALAGESVANLQAGKDTELLARATLAQANALSGNGDWKGALSTLQPFSMAPSDFPADLRTELALKQAKVLQNLGRLAQADEAYARAAAAAIQARGVGSDAHLRSLASRVYVHVLNGDNERAERESQAALALLTSSSATSPGSIDVVEARAAAMQNLDRADEALALRERAVALTESIYPEGHPRRTTALNNLASALYGLRRYSEAADLLQKIAAELRRTLPKDHPRLALALNNLGALRLTQGHLAEAHELYDQAYQSRRARFGDAHYSLSESLYGRGLANLRLGNEAAAATDLIASADLADRATPGNFGLRVAPRVEAARATLDQDSNNNRCANAHRALALADEPGAQSLSGWRAYANGILQICLISEQNVNPPSVVLLTELHSAWQLASTQFGVSHERSRWLAKRCNAISAEACGG